MLATTLQAVDNRVIASAKRISFRQKQIALSSFKRGYVPDTFQEEYVNAAFPLMTDTLVYSYLRGYRSAVLSAEAHHKANTLELSVLTSSINALKKLLNIDVEKLETQFKIVGLRALRSATNKADKAVRAIITTLLESGTTVPNAVIALDDAFDVLGLSPAKSFALETMYRTAASVGFGAGSWAGYSDPAIQEILWGFDYSAIDDSRVRTNHWAANNVALPKDDPFWQYMWPPNGYNCRCIPVALFSEPQGGPVQPPSDGSAYPDKGWGYNVGVVLQSNAAQVAFSLAFDESKYVRDSIGRFAEKPGVAATLSKTEPVQKLKVARQTETPQFKKWFDESVVTKPDGSPLVVYHGTTNEFAQFDRSKQNPESFLGAGFYFTTTADDAAHNYASEAGPDKANRIAQLADSLAGGENDDGEEIDYDTAKKMATEMVSQGRDSVLPVFLSIQKPLIIEGDEPTMWSTDYEYDGDPEDDDTEVTTTGEPVKFAEALREVIENGNYESVDVDKLIEDITPLGDERKPAMWYIRQATESEGLQYAEQYNDETGNPQLMSSEIVRQALQKMGYDGVVDYGAWGRWGKKSRDFPSVISRDFQGMNESTVHYIVFEPTQIKSAIGNSGSFDAKNPDIRLSLAFDESKIVRDEIGQFAEKPGVTSPKFKKWFGNSKVINRDGSPRIVYHGTGGTFDKFRTVLEKEWGMADRGLGAHFANDPEMTNAFTVGQYAWPSDFNVPSDNPLENSWYKNRDGELKYDGTPVIIFDNPDRSQTVEAYDPKKHGYSWGLGARYREKGIDAQLRVLPPGFSVMPVYLSIQNPLIVKPAHENEMDQTAVARSVAEIVFPEDKELFVNAATSNLGMQKAHAEEMWEGFKRGEPQKRMENETYKNMAELIGDHSTLLNGREAIEGAKTVLRKLGYDGLQYENTSHTELAGVKDKTVWIALDPEQIKSAIGNEGEYDKTKKELHLAFDESKVVRDEIGQFAEKGTSSEAFKKWFGDSKVVDENGKPLRVYHGTASNFRAFDNPFKEMFSGINWNMFSDNSKYSANFAVAGGGESILPLYLSIQKPLDLTHIPAHGGDARVKFLATLERVGFSSEAMEIMKKKLRFESAMFQIVHGGEHHETLTQELTRLGYDGIKLNEYHLSQDKPGDPITREPTITWIVWDATQVKSAIGNRGTFDKTKAELDLAFDERLHPRGQPTNKGQFAENPNKSNTTGNGPHNWGKNPLDAFKSIRDYFLGLGVNADSAERIAKELAPVNHGDNVLPNILNAPYNYTNQQKKVLLDLLDGESVAANVLGRIQPGTSREYPWGDTAIEAHRNIAEYFRNHADGFTALEAAAIADQTAELNAGSNFVPGTLQGKAASWDGPSRSLILPKFLNEALQKDGMRMVIPDWVEPEEERRYAFKPWGATQQQAQLAFFEYFKATGENEQAADVLASTVAKENYGSKFVAGTVFVPHDVGPQRVANIERAFAGFSDVTVEQRETPAPEPPKAKAKRKKKAKAGKLPELQFDDPEYEEVLANYWPELSNEDIVEATGAQPNLDLVVKVQEVTEDRIFVTVSHPEAKVGMERSFVRYHDGIRLENDLFKIYDEKMRGKGLGWSAFSQQVDTAQRLGFTEIKTHAVGADETGWNGYITWAKFGYNTELSENIRDSFANDTGREVEDLHDLMRTPEGREWWEKKGEEFWGTFDLTGQSDDGKSLKAFNAYRNYKDKGGTRDYEFATKHTAAYYKKMNMHDDAEIDMWEDDSEVLDFIWDNLHLEGAQLDKAVSIKFSK
jgi:hypothetical protein